MREIKFRGWHSSLNKMFTAEELGQDQLTLMPDGRGFINVSGYSTELSELVPMIPLQYTGLKDKNEKDIYEYDIVHVIYEDGRDLMGVDADYKDFVYFNNHCSSFMIHRNNGSDSLENDLGKSIEVIGNIYENPELLK